MTAAHPRDVDLPCHGGTRRDVGWSLDVNAWAQALGSLVRAQDD
jgi:hypothetical protein